MKKLLFGLFAAALIVTSCSKEAKLNKKLDGKWNVVTYAGSPMPSGSSISISFAKDKKGKGTYTSTNTMGSVVMTETGTYDLVDDVTIYMLESTAGSTQDTMTVTAYSKTDLTLSTVSAPIESIVLKKE